MPTTFNISPPIPGLNLNVRSVRCFFWPSSEDKTAEVALTLSHFVAIDGFAQNNLGGAFLGSGYVDTGLLSVTDRYASLSVQQIMTEAFG